MDDIPQIRAAQSMVSARLAHMERVQSLAKNLVARQRETFPPSESPFIRYLLQKRTSEKTPYFSPLKVERNFPASSSFPPSPSSCGCPLNTRRTPGECVGDARRTHLPSLLYDIPHRDPSKPPHHKDFYRKAENVFVLQEGSPKQTQPQTTCHLPRDDTTCPRELGKRETSAREDIARGKAPISYRETSTLKNPDSEEYWKEQPPDGRRFYHPSLATRPSYTFKPTQVETINSFARKLDSSTDKSHSGGFASSGMNDCNVRKERIPVRQHQGLLSGVEPSSDYPKEEPMRAERIKNSVSTQYSIEDLSRGAGHVGRAIGSVTCAPTCSLLTHRDTSGLDVSKEADVPDFFSSFSKQLLRYRKKNECLAASFSDVMEEEDEEERQNGPETATRLREYCDHRRLRKGGKMPPGVLTLQSSCHKDKRSVSDRKRYLQNKRQDQTNRNKEGTAVTSSKYLQLPALTAWQFFRELHEVVTEAADLRERLLKTYCLNFEK